MVCCRLTVEMQQGMCFWQAIRQIQDGTVKLTESHMVLSNLPNYRNLSLENHLLHAVFSEIAEIGGAEGDKGGVW